MKMTKKKFKITKLAVTCWLLGVAFLLMGTGFRSYFFEAIAVLMFLFGYVIADWDDLFSGTNNKK
jgi:hypothetical protein